MNEIVFHITPAASGGYVAEAIVSPAEQIITQGDSLQAVLANIADALACHFEEFPHVCRISYRLLANPD